MVFMIVHKEGNSNRHLSRKPTCAFSISLSISLSPPPPPSLSKLPHCIDRSIKQGYAAAHELVTDTMAAGAEGEGDVALSAVIVDHIAAACRLCLVQKPGGAGAPGGSKFPLSPPLWARMGAADSSTHGIIASTDDSSKGSGKKGSESPFFPAKSPGTEKTSSSSHSSASARSGGDVVSGGEGSGHDSSATVPPVAAAGTTTGSSSSNLFKGGTMFSGMKINMGEIFKKGAATSNNPEEGASAEAAGPKGSSNTTAPAAADKPEEAGKGDGEPATDLAAKLRISLGRFGSLKEVKKDADGVGSEAAMAAAAAGGSSEKDKDSGIGSLFRKVGWFELEWCVDVLGVLERCGRVETTSAVSSNHTASVLPEKLCIYVLFTRWMGWEGHGRSRIIQSIYDPCTTYVDYSPSLRYTFLEVGVVDPKSKGTGIRTVSRRTFLQRRFNVCFLGRLGPKSE